MRQYCLSAVKGILYKVKVMIAIVVLETSQILFELKHLGGELSTVNILKLEKA